MCVYTKNRKRSRMVSLSSNIDPYLINWGDIVAFDDSRLYAVVNAFFV